MPGPGALDEGRRAQDPDSRQEPAGGALVGAALAGLRRAAEGVESERALADAFQRSLLLDRLPAVAGLQLAARYVAAGGDAAVGGDWYDVIVLPNGAIG